MLRTILIIALVALLAVASCVQEVAEEEEPLPAISKTTTTAAPATALPGADASVGEAIPSEKGAPEGTPAAEEGNVVTTDSGLQYVDLAVGEGQAAKSGDTVKVHYTGWLKKDGAKFDSSLDNGVPFSFQLGAGKVIKGWDEGVAGMKVGGKRKLTIPPELGYGAQGAGPIPPNATLVFEVELLEIVG